MSYLSAIDLIKSQQMSAWVQAETDQLNKKLLNCQMKLTRIQVFYMPVLDYANNVMKILILGLGGYMLMQQELTLGEITAFFDLLSAAVDAANGAWQNRNHLSARYGWYHKCANHPQCGHPGD
ncbi:ATP-binding protein of ABC transporter [Vibrio variabilis]|uniref:ATP-binding protein of ABC transporter n=1 Tax=Vibrio variabilis TaxID=990271 RepID=A0ABQ0JD41_9VIBR|nr:ATP-binding protein of ABC transporter [Vibrio variabilis]